MAQKIKSTLLTMSLVLFLIGAISAGTLAYVYKLTKDPIERANKQKDIRALSLVLPKFDNSPIDETVKVAGDKDSLTCYIARKDGKIVGVAVKSYTYKGFSGYFSVMVGFDMEGNIINTMMLEHHETPGLGDKADKTKTNWSDQFNGKNPGTSNLKVKKDGGEIDQITAATITSRAYVDAVERAYRAFQEVKNMNL